MEYMVNLWWTANQFRWKAENYLNYKKEDKIHLISFRLIIVVSLDLSTKE